MLNRELQRAIRTTPTVVLDLSALKFIAVVPGAH
jgi:hypothetical protein